jgi:hypothetical protein
MGTWVRAAWRNYRALPPSSPVRMMIGISMIMLTGQAVVYLAIGFVRLVVP